MKRKIALKIDVTKIDKKRLFTSEKTGSVYLDMIYHYDDVADQYGNHGMITESVSKEERDNDVKGTILGNGKIVWTERVEEPKPDTGVTDAKIIDKFDATIDKEDDGLPFSPSIY